ncbi:MAG: hypothetical protein N3B13_01990 [Deltaproteobacteria bacterium]|nr:hypothetical protein [Deltaproteobacteria bacterium]
MILLNYMKPLRYETRFYFLLGFLIASPFIFLLAIVFFNYLNPLRIAYLEEIEIINASGEKIWVTPIGMLESSGKYGPLPRYTDKSFPAIPRGSAHNIKLKPRQYIKLIYNWDNINFRYLLIYSKNGGTYIMETDRRGDLHTTYPPKQKRYIIPPLRELKQAPRELLPCIKGKYVKYIIEEFPPELPDASYSDLSSAE